MNLQVSAVLFLCVSGCAYADKLCLVGDFDAQVQYILDQQYLNSEQMLNLTRVYDDLKHTLEQKWTGITIIPFGSLVTGLASKLSDVDIIIKVQNFSQSAEKYLFEHTRRLIEGQPKLYTLVSSTPVRGRRLPVIKLVHNPTKASCDISFRSKSGMENSKLLGYYFKLDERNLALASLIKFWSKVHRNINAGIFRCYALYLLILFYLEQKGLAPPTYLLLQNLGNRSFTEWDQTFTEIHFKSTNNESLYELLGGFFKFYSELNLKDNVVSPFIGKVIPRSVFRNNGSIPEELAEYKRYLNWVKNSEPIVLDTEMCIIDIFEQSNNIAEPVTSENVGNFAYNVNLAVRAFNELPSERFLTAILTRNDRDIELAGKEPVDEIKTYEDCLNVTSKNL